MGRRFFLVIVSITIKIALLFLLFPNIVLDSALVADNAIDVPGLDVREASCSCRGFSSCMSSQGFLVYVIVRVAA